MYSHKKKRSLNSLSFVRRAWTSHKQKTKENDNSTLAIWHNKGYTPKGAFFPLFLCLFFTEVSKFRTE